VILRSFAKHMHLHSVALPTDRHFQQAGLTVLLE